MTIGEIKIVRGNAVFGGESVSEAHTIELQLHKSRSPTVGGWGDLRDNLRGRGKIGFPPDDGLHSGVAAVGRAVGAADDEAEVSARAGERPGVVELDAGWNVCAIDSDCALVLIKHP